MDLRRWLSDGVDAVEEWQAGFGPFERHASLQISDEQFARVFGDFTERLRDNYPFFHPSYAGQMLKPPHPAAVAAYLMAMLVNPNNHALDGGPGDGGDGARGGGGHRRRCSALPRGLPGPPHLQRHDRQPGGALRGPRAAARPRPSPSARRATTPTSGCAGCSASAGSGCPPTTGDGMDLEALERVLRAETVGTVVLTAGTTALGAVDPVDEALALPRAVRGPAARRRRVRGLLTLLGGSGAAGLAAGSVAGHRRSATRWWSTRTSTGCSRTAAAACCSPTRTSARFYVHDSPYTYFTSAELHLGEISLECSRAGAAAAALWLTFQLLPPTPDGLGRALAAGRRAAVAWARLSPTPRPAPVPAAGAGHRLVLPGRRAAPERDR